MRSTIGYGVNMKTIPLTHNKTAIVDDCDYDMLCRSKWRLATFLSSSKQESFYAIGWIKGSGRDQLMHRIILGLERGDPRVCDHINGNGLDNRRCNLRICSHSENIRNQKTHRKNNSSGFKGVYFNKRAKKWQAYITCTWKITYLGLFDTKEDAANAYNAAATKFHGQFARLNTSNSNKE